VWQTFTVDMWKTHIQIAQSSGIDGFALNTAPSENPAGGTSGAIGTQLSNAFQAAVDLNSTFKLFIAFDYLGGNKPWNVDDVKSTIQLYANNSAYFQFNGRPYVSTFEGTQNVDDWTSIRASVPGGIFFVPAWTSLGPEGIKSQLGIIDGAYSWDMWPLGPFDKTSASDMAWKDALGGKHYMMGSHSYPLHVPYLNVFLGISPWFYANLPGYAKSWVWRGDDLWHTRWDQINELQPDMVQIVTWNDYGESHYVGPIVDSGIPQDETVNADARPYVEGMPHDDWRNLLPYYISRFKNNGIEPLVTNETVQYWYRLTSATAGSYDGVTGGNGPTYDPAAVMQDKVFFTALVNAPSTISLQIGDYTPSKFEIARAGINHFSQLFNGQTGNVTLSVERDGQRVLDNTGAAILPKPTNGITNFNAWVGGVSAQSF
jgi:glucan endo-1,3-alpha-glucosidase